MAPFNPFAASVTMPSAAAVASGVPLPSTATPPAIPEDTAPAATRDPKDAEAETSAPSPSSSPSKPMSALKVGSGEPRPADAWAETTAAEEEDEPRQDRLRSRVLLRKGRVVQVSDPMTELNNEQRIKIMLAVKDGTLTMDQALDVARDVADATRAGDDVAVARSMVRFGRRQPVPGHHRGRLSWGAPQTVGRRLWCKLTTLVPPRREQTKTNKKIITSKDIDFDLAPEKPKEPKRAYSPSVLAQLDDQQRLGTLRSVLRALAADAPLRKKREPRLCRPLRRGWLQLWLHLWFGLVLWFGAHDPNSPALSAVAPQPS